jgi:hypothetical protein
MMETRWVDNKAIHRIVVGVLDEPFQNLVASASGFVISAERA